ncbi:hypothetical protein J4211_01405 [Candidatus Woesearchaeota archaeon]|nr:hypothetical protein [uncultured archaeon]AQS33863.1 hypothetical protein [uncultured archaeon]MBS3124893.1 hypothetical protein [Candidatus Woesearchaeota archaeon]
MKKVVFGLVLLALVFVACGSKTTGKRVAVPPASGVTGAVTAPDSQPAFEAKSAAEILGELKSQGTTAITPIRTGAKSGTFYPPVQVSGTGKDALKEKTKALMSNGSSTPGNVDAQRDFGPKYYSSGGSPTNLPSNYGNEDSAGE